MPNHSKPKLGNRRVTGKEQYYTPEPLAARLVNTLDALVGGLENRTVLEPAGGTGAFVKAAKAARATKIVALDIEPKARGIKAADFLQTELALRQAVTVSNPPFGRNNSLSVRFFNHAADTSDYIAFIVPKSWRKWSVINRLDRRFHLIHDEDLEIQYVNENGGLLTERNHLATVFQVWQRREQLRPIISVTDNNIVTKVTPQDADVALTIFGYGCGRVRTEFKREKNTTQMYLKLNHPKALEALQTVDFSRFFRNTAYTEALSLQEINYLLNEHLLGQPGLKENHK